VRCTKAGHWALRKDAQARLLELWSQGHLHLRRAYWCKQHQAYHLTKLPVWTSDAPASKT
jgi:hypothetical protein